MIWAFLTVALAAALLVGMKLLRRRLADTDYVCIEENGEPRELTEDEAAFLAEEFHPADSARPYIKSRYGERTPMGSLEGFLLRRQVPRRFRRRS